MINYPLPCRHGALKAEMPGFFWVQGSIRMPGGARISRNMAVLREGDDLTLVNPVRLKPAAEERLAKLGRIRHLVRLGYFHGRDDLYYRDQYHASFWCQQGSARYPAPPLDQPLQEGGPVPFSGARVFEFRNARRPEAALWLPLGGGLLLTCDAVQYWGDWHRCNWRGRLLLALMGFRSGMQVSLPWRRYMCPRGQPQGYLAEDFERLLALDFCHHLGAHGSLCRHDAHQRLGRAVQRLFG